MKTNEDIVQALGTLSANDRTWIIDRLSPKMRETLLSVGNTSARPHPVAPNDIRSFSSATDVSPATGSQSSSSKALDMASALQIYAVLKREPAWVMHAILARPWPWQDKVRGLLTPAQQIELQSLESAGIRYAERITELAIDGLAGSLVGGTSVVTRSPFEALVASFGAKLARKRMSLQA